MLDLFHQFTHFLKIQESVTIDNNVFRLHYKVSFNALFLGFARNLNCFDNFNF